MHQLITNSIGRKSFTYRENWLDNFNTTQQTSRALSCLVSPVGGIYAVLLSETNDDNQKFICTITSKCN